MSRRSKNSRSSKRTSSNRSSRRESKSNREFTTDVTDQFYGDDGKVRIDFNPRPFEFSRTQKELISTILDDTNSIFFVSGVAGTSKSYISIYAALKLLDEGPYEDILYLRSVIESASKSLGALPGELEDKFAPYMGPLEDKLEELVSKDTITLLKSNKIVTAAPINFIRGASWRNKVVVVDECFEDSVFVETDKGRVMLRKILKDPDSFKALSYNESSDLFEFKNITNTFNRGVKNISLMSLDGRAKIKSTKSHRYLTESGWKRMEDLKVGDAIVSSSNNKHSKSSLGQNQMDVLIGSILGDGGVSTVAKNSYRLKILHGQEQLPYLIDKAEIFDCGDGIRHIAKNGYAQTPANSFCTGSFYLPCEKADLKKYAIDKLTIASLAIAWQDDGYYCEKAKHGLLWSCATSKEDCGLLVEKLNAMGYSCHLDKKKKKDAEYYVVRFRNDGFRKMSEDVAPYTSESMAYKIPKDLRDKVGTFSWISDYKSYSLRVVTDLDFDVYENQVYDIEVEDNHNFVVSSHRKGDGTKVVAHNCQNMDPSELTTIISRVGEGTKLIICGDPNQSDIRNSGFESMFELFNDSESYQNGIATFEFADDDIYRSEILKFVVQKLKSL